MKTYEASIKHNESSLTALSHMQYDLFCVNDRRMKTLLAMGLFIAGALNIETWWGLLLIAYGSYLFSSKYSAANRTARQLTEQLKASGDQYPSSKYIFDEKHMRIITLPNNNELDPLPYSEVEGLGEDLENFYIFQNQYGGYMVPKKSLGDDDTVYEFRKFIEAKTGKIFLTRRSRFVAIRQWMKKRENEPYHL